MMVKYVCRECGKKFLESDTVELEVGRHINKHVDKNYMTPIMAQRLLRLYGHNLHKMIDRVREEEFL